MRQAQNMPESERTSWAQDRGVPHRQLNSQASSATLRLPRQRAFNVLDSRRERTDINIAQGLLKEEPLNQPQRRSPFDASPVPYNRRSFNDVDGQSDGPEHSLNPERNRKDRNTSNTWTDSSLGTEVEDEEDRTQFVNEYNRLAEKHGVRKIVPEGYESVDVDTVTVVGKHGSWIMRKLLRRTSSMQTLKVKTDKHIRHKRSISDFSTRLRMKKEPLKDKTLKELVDICGRSLLYLPSEYAAASLSLPTCLRATAHHIVQHGITSRGIFRIPGSSSSTLTLYNYYATVGECADVICGTVRAPALPEHLNYEVHDVASVFKRFLSGLPGGILQGSTNLFEALIAIQSHLNSDPEWTRTKQSKVRARLIALAIGSVRSRLQRELICAVFGLLCMIGRAAELAPREDDRGRPLPTSGLMGYGALGIIFGPLLLGEGLDSYEMRFAPGGAIVFPITPQKDPSKTATQKGTDVFISDEYSYAASRFDRVKIANGITEMLITHWRDVVRHMRGLGILKTSGDCDRELNKTRRSHLRPYASELFTLRKPPEWGTDNSFIRRVHRTPSPVTPIERHISQSEPGPVSQHNDLQIRKQRYRTVPPTVPTLSDSKSMGTLPPMVEEPIIEDQCEKIPSASIWPQSSQVSRPPFLNRLRSHPPLHEAIEQLKSPPTKEENVIVMTETSDLLAEVARELRNDAQRRMSAQPAAELTVSVAELPSLLDGEATQGLKPLEKANKEDIDNTVVDPPSHLAKEDANPGKDTPLKVSTENGSRVRLVQTQTPRSNARNFFEKANQDALISSTARGLKDQGSPRNRVFPPRTNISTKIRELVPPGPIEPPVTPVQQQTEVIVTAKTTPKNQARQYFERADKERASASASAEREKRKADMSDKANIVQPDLRNAGTKSPAVQRESESKSYSPIRTHAARSEPPLRSDEQRSSTSKTAEAIQLGSVSSEPAHTPHSNNATIEKLHPIPSPLPRLENSKHHKDLASNAEIQKPSERPQIPLRRPQNLVANRIRGLLISDPGSRKPQHPVPRAAPNTVQTPIDVEQHKSDDGSAKSPTVSAKDVLERVSRAEGLNSLSVLAHSTSIRTPVTSAKEPLDLEEGLVSAHENGLADIEGQIQGTAEEQQENSNLRTERGSENQKSDSSNVTVILLPKKITSTSEPIGVSRISSGSSDGSKSTITSSPKLVDQTRIERPPMTTTESVSGVVNTSGGNTTLSPRHNAGQAPMLEVPQHVGDRMDVAQTPEKRPPRKVAKGSAGSVMALAAKFNNAEPTPPLGSPIKRVKPRGVIHHSLFQPADRLISNYTTNSPSSTKTPQSEKSDIRTIPNPLHLDRRPDFQSRKTPHKEISPLYRTPGNSGARESKSPSPLPFSKTPPAALKRSAVDGGDSVMFSVDNRSPGRRRPSPRLLHNHSPSIRESLGSRTSSVGTVLPHPIEPPVDQNVPFIRPPSTPRRPVHDQEVFRVMTPSSNAALYEQIRKLQKQLEAATEELAQYKQLVESRGNLQDLGTLSAQLRESKREARSWKVRAELAERRLVMLEGIKGKAEYGPGDGNRDGNRDGEDRYDSEPSVVAVFNKNKSRNAHEGESRMTGEATDYFTQSTDTEVWVRGGTATIIRGSGGGGGGGHSSSRGSRDHASEETVIHDMANIPNLSESDAARFMDPSLKASRKDFTTTDDDGFLSSWNFGTKDERMNRSDPGLESE